MRSNRRPVPCFSNRGFAPVLDCSSQTALKVEPEKGKVIMFYNLCADGSLDEASLHGACPVTTDEGEKWVANKWIWCVWAAQWPDVHVYYTTLYYYILHYCVLYYYILHYCVQYYCILHYCVLYYCILHCCILHYWMLHYCAPNYCILHYCVLYYCILHYCVFYYCILHYCVLYYCVLYYCFLHCCGLFCWVHDTRVVSVVVLPSADRRSHGRQSMHCFSSNIYITCVY